MFITPPLAIVKGLPLKVPENQLNTPLTAIGLLRLMVVPLVKLMVSPEAGTPAGIQLVLLNQSVEIEPFQVWVAAEHQPTFSKTESKNP
jgi:hypothetical protein